MLRLQFELGPATFSNGILLPSRALSFTLTNRVSTGEAVLAANGLMELVALSDFQAPTTGRSTTIEFGTYNVPATSTTRWTTLGLPKRSVPAHVEVHPQTINKKAKGQFVTVLIESHGSWRVEDVDLDTVTLQAVAPVVTAALAVAAGSPTELGDANGNGILDRTVKFDRATVQSWFGSDTMATFRVAGRLFDGQSFRGEAVARIIDAGAEHTNETHPGSIR